MYTQHYAICILTRQMCVLFIRYYFEAAGCMNLWQENAIFSSHIAVVERTDLLALAYFIFRVFSSQKKFFETDYKH